MKNISYQTSVYLHLGAAVALVLMWLSALPAHAQDVCDGRSLAPSQLVSRAEQRCCSFRGTRRQRCLAPLVRAQRRANEALFGSAFSQTLREIAGDFVARRCTASERTLLPACTIESEVTPGEFEIALRSQCGAVRPARRQQLVQRAARAIQSFRQARLLLRQQARRYERVTRRLQNDEVCGGGDPFPSFCSRFFSPDGSGGFLARPSERTNSPVVLFPQGVDVSNCRFINAATGRTVAEGFSTGFANENREHIRMRGEPRCERLPENLLIACRSGECAELSAGVCGRTD